MSTSPSGTAAPPDKDGWVAAYEELRRQILNGQRGPGLTPFMRSGMKELMKACSLCAVPPALQVVTAAHDEAVLPQGVRSEVVLILAGMLLYGCQEVRP
jgi:hypothetical protein